MKEPSIEWLTDAVNQIPEGTINHQLLYHCEEDMKESAAFGLPYVPRLIILQSVSIKISDEFVAKYWQYKNILILSDNPELVSTSICKPIMSVQ